MPAFTHKNWRSGSVANSHANASAVSSQSNKIKLSGSSASRFNNSAPPSAAVRTCPFVKGSACNRSMAGILSSGVRTVLSSKLTTSPPASSRNFNVITKRKFLYNVYDFVKDDSYFTRRVHAKVVRRPEVKESGPRRVCASCHSSKQRELLQSR